MEIFQRTWEYLKSCRTKSHLASNQEINRNDDVVEKKMLKNGRNDTTMYR